MFKRKGHGKNREESLVTTEFFSSPFEEMRGTKTYAIAEQSSTGLS